MPKTPVSDAFESIRDLLVEAYDIVPETASGNALLEHIHGQLAQVWTKTQRQTRDEVADRIEELGKYRMEYVTGVDDSQPIQHAGDIAALPGMLQVVYGEATGARTLASIIRGSDPRGWLPSWRFDKA